MFIPGVIIFFASLAGIFVASLGALSQLKRGVSHALDLSDDLLSPDQFVRHEMPTGEMPLLDEPRVP